jgi:dTDP-L-rhamnose 4-epimerase
MRGVLITGGLGFIGLNVAKELEEHGYSLILFDNLSSQVHGQVPRIDSPLLSSPNVSVVRGDLTDAAGLRAALRGADAVVHLAAETGTAQSMYEISRYNWVNSQGTAVLLQVLASEQHTVRKLILASSRSIYGEGAHRCASCGIVYPQSRPLTALQAHDWELHCPYCDGATSAAPTPESARPNPCSIYAATKLAQEDLVRISCGALGIRNVVLRLQNVYGEGQSLNNPYTGILSIFSTRIRRGLSVHVFEDGLESRDFVHVTDVARVIRLSLENDRASGRILNVGSGKPTTVLEVAGLLARTLGSSSGPEITQQFRLGDIRHCYADLSLISKILDFQPQVSLESGIDRFAQWVEGEPLSKDRPREPNDELTERKMMG